MATVNLAPAEARKTGSGFDLPIAARVLGAWEVFPPQALEGLMLVGELSLDGRLRPVRGILPMALTAREQGARAMVLPRANEREAAVEKVVPLLPVVAHEDATALPCGEVEPEWAPSCTLEGCR